MQRTYKFDAGFFFLPNKLPGYRAQICRASAIQQKTLSAHSEPKKMPGCEKLKQCRFICCGTVCFVSLAVQMSWKRTENKRQSSFPARAEGWANLVITAAISITPDEKRRLSASGPCGHPCSAGMVRGEGSGAVHDDDNDDNDNNRAVTQTGRSAC